MIASGKVTDLKCLTFVRWGTLKSVSDSKAKPIAKIKTCVWDVFSRINDGMTKFQEAGNPLNQKSSVS
jgi:hypothetical protein